MNLSKKEKTMISCLGIAVVAFIYYQFGYLNLEKFIDRRVAQEQEIKTKYNNAKDTIEKIEIQRSNVKILNCKIGQEAKGIYPTVSQEHIISEIDKLIVKCDLYGGMEFEDVKIDEVDVIEKSKKDIVSLESSLQQTADKYNNMYGDKKDKKNSGNSTIKESESTDKTQSKDTSNTTESAKKDNKNNKENKVLKMTGKVKFYGTYQNVIKFVKALEGQDKKICLFGIGMEINEDTEWVKGELGIGVYSVPKIDESMSKYLIWSINNIYGKSEPFLLNTSAGSAVKAEKTGDDFVISAKTQESELPNIMIGKANDTLMSSYVFADGNNKQEAEIVFSEQDDKYYYKYKTSNGSMPVDYSGKGIQFTPNGENIDINIISEGRTGDTDKAGLKLKVVNETGKQVNVEINADDKNDPRVSIDHNGEKIIVTKK